MKTTLLRYNVLIEKEGKYYVAYVPTLGISDFGKTIDNAKQNIQEAIQCHIEGLAKTGAEIPNPDRDDAILSSAHVTVFGNLKLAL